MIASNINYHQKITKSVKNSNNRAPAQIKFKSQEAHIKAKPRKIVSTLNQSPEGLVQKTVRTRKQERSIEKPRGDTYNILPSVRNYSNIPSGRIPIQSRRIPNSNTVANNLQTPFDEIKNFFAGFGIEFPVVDSPFTGRVARQELSDEIFDPTFAIFGAEFNNFFRDNFSSNFRSNHIMEMFEDAIMLLTSANSGNSRSIPHPPTSKEALKALKRFKMNDKYCKKTESGKFESPNCCICISEIVHNDDTVLLPCGHMYHSKCIIIWLKKNNTCPVCRFRLS